MATSDTKTSTVCSIIHPHDPWLSLQTAPIFLWRMHEILQTQPCVRKCNTWHHCLHLLTYGGGRRCLWKNPAVTSLAEACTLKSKGLSLSCTKTEDENCLKCRSDTAKTPFTGAGMWFPNKNCGLESTHPISDELHLLALSPLRSKPVLLCVAIILMMTTSTA